MIAVETRGRLGNQMFQFAFGLAAGKMLGVPFAIRDDLLRGYFMLGGYERPGRRLVRAVKYRLARRRGAFTPAMVGEEADPDQVIAGLSDWSEYHGFFQSERFFADAADDVRRAFRPRADVLERFRARHAELITRPYVCCHVRRTDYHEFRGGVVLPFAYYAECLERLDVGTTPIAIVGDDLAEMHELFGGIPGVRVCHGSEIDDLLLLVHAAEVVVSNSSFAWWGAWLNRSAERVLAPRYWLGFREGFERPPAVVPASWEQLTVPSADAWS